MNTRMRLLSVLALTAAMTACGGGGGSSAPVPPSPAPAPVPTPSPPPPPPPPAPPPAPVIEKPSTRMEAARFLTQATFGPTEPQIDRVMQLGYAAWIDEQLAMPAVSYRANWEAADARIKAANANNSANNSAGQTEVLEAFWTQAIAGPDQLRLRMAYALSQIFVISVVDGTVNGQPRAVAAWLDLLASQGLGNYRDLLEAVSRHPLMGAYLSHLRNQRADARTGRVPDENYSREVLQLFSIGLVKLDESGASTGEATYSPADVSGLAKVFTGWSYACPDWPDNACFSQGSANGSSDPDRWFKPMLGYPQYHSAEEKKFLGVTIAAQALPDPFASLKAALDGIHAHPNVGPFIGKLLIQRLVTSNPSPAYITAVSRAFANNGAGVRGDMRAVLKAVLMHPEARQPSDQAGKLREPVLRLTAMMRAFGFASETGSYKVGNTDNPSTSLGQAPLRAPNVFNFYRPGYVPPGTKAGAAGLAVPEMQILHETSTAGYVNTLRDAVSLGVGSNAPSGKRDLQPDLAAELALADKPAELVARVTAKLIPAPVQATLSNTIVTAVSSIAIPVLAANGSNQKAVDDAKRARVNTALLLTAVAPEFLVQK